MARVLGNDVTKPRRSHTNDYLQGQPGEGSVQFYDDGTQSFFWRAHTVTALVLISSVLIYVTLFEKGSEDTNANVRRGMMAVVIVFILIGVIHIPDGPFIRPHPALWRLALCVMIVYILLLIFALFQTVDDARQFLTLYDPELGKPLPERTYAQDCRIYAPDHPDGPFANVLDKFDVFVLCHLIGWYVKAVIVRDVWLLTIISVGFELLEYTLECQLPNFGECWWDHWILDFLVCNGLGIYLGMLTCEYLSMKTYHWSGLWKIPTFRGKLKRAVGQFGPYNWTQFQWGYTQSFKRFIFVFLIGCAWMIQELNVFYLKSVLWVPPNHSLNFYREALYGFIGACAMAEMYEYLQSSDPNARIGRFPWMIFAALTVETLIEIKFGWEILSIVPPTSALVFWGVLFTALVVWVFWHFTYPFKDWPILGEHIRKLTKMFVETNKKRD